METDGSLIKGMLRLFLILPRRLPLFEVIAEPISMNGDEVQGYDVAFI